MLTSTSSVENPKQNTCTSLNYTGCCVKGECSVNDTCYCDRDCHRRGDCCSDIENIGCYGMHINKVLMIYNVCLFSAPNSCNNSNIHKEECRSDTIAGACKVNTSNSTSCYCDNCCERRNDCCEGFTEFCISSANSSASAGMYNYYNYHTSFFLLFLSHFKVTGAKGENYT